MKKRHQFLALALVAGMCLGGCSGTKSASSSESASTEASASTESGTLTVFAANSLKKPFEEIANDLFAQEYPNVEVTFSFEGSSTLVDQLKNGAPADIFASADEKNMTKATDANLVEEVKPFASNTLALIVPSGNPAGITGLDSSLDGKKLVICADGVPCGNATRELASNLGVTLNPVSEEQKVGDVLAKVESGEADAGLVYVTDAKKSEGKVEVVPVEGIDQVVNSYPIALVSESKQKELAEKFIDLVLSDEGQAVLAKYGFKESVATDQK